MDDLKLIPEIFFDLIGRVIPGSVGILAFLLLTGRTWEALSRVVWVRCLHQAPPPYQFS